MKKTTTLKSMAVLAGLALMCWLATIFLPLSLVDAGVDYTVVLLARALVIVSAVSVLAPIVAIRVAFMSMPTIISAR